MKIEKDVLLVTLGLLTLGIIGSVVIQLLKKPKVECEEGTTEVTSYCPDNTTPQMWRECVNGVWVEKIQDCPTECEEGTTEVTSYCPDKITPQVWRECVWVEKTQECPTECEEGDIKYFVCVDPKTGETTTVVQSPRMMPPENSIIIGECVDGKWVDLHPGIPFSWCWEP